MQYVRVKQLLQCDANSRDGEQSMNCIFYHDSGSVRTGRLWGCFFLHYTWQIYHSALEAACIAYSAI